MKIRGQDCVSLVKRIISKNNVLENCKINEESRGVTHQYCYQATVIYFPIDTGSC